MRTLRTLRALPAFRFAGALVFVTAVMIRCSPYEEEPSSVPATDSGVGEAGSIDANANDDSAATSRDASTDPFEEPKPPTSCVDLRGRDAATGVYAIAPPDGDGGVDVYCDMTTVEGGWTLVGRSVSGAVGGSFGWKQSRGDVRDDGAPYSLDVRKIGPFKEMLVGRSLAKALVPPIFRKTVPPAFLASYTAGALITPTLTAVGMCEPAIATGPLMLEYIGHTDLVDHFFFRDQPTTEVFGLHATGWNANTVNDCSFSGNLHNQQAMIFVR